MLQSQLFPKTKKETVKDAESINHKLLVQAGFMDQLMAGSWSLLPLGLRVVNKISKIVREEMNATGALEIALPLLHPKNIWNETGRWDKAREVMYQFKDTRDKEFALSFTHEEILMDLLRKHVSSYQDFPIYLYQFSTKFRNEPRARSGILRGREFLMKDLYSAHTSEEDLMEYYEKVKEGYKRVFERIGFEFRIAEASGGVFTEKHTHEFQVLDAGGEDTIYYCDSCSWGANKEIFEGKVGDTCANCNKGKVLENTKAVEIGNIFPLGTRYAELMRFYFTDNEGKKKPIWFGSYGIGITRVMGTLVEKFHDERGIVWPKSVAPFEVHLIGLSGKGEEEYKKLSEAGIDVLFDDRDTSAGAKFADADLIGIPVRLVVSEKTAGQVEWKDRNSDATQLLSLDEVLQKLAE